MNDFMSKPRFQIPSLKELQQAHLLKLLREKEPLSGTELNFALSAEHRRRKREENPSNDGQQTDSNKERTRHRAEALAFYRSILRDPNATVDEQLTARERIDSLLGLDLG